MRIALVMQTFVRRVRLLYIMYYHISHKGIEKWRLKKYYEDEFYEEDYQKGLYKKHGYSCGRCGG